MRYIQITIAALSALLVVSCGSYSKLLKSDDTEKKYTAGIRYYNQRDYHKAITLFGDIMNDKFGSAQEDTILFYLGKAHYNTRQYDVSAQLMDQYRKSYSRTAFAEESEYLLGMSYYMMSAPVERDQGSTRQAITTINEYLNRHPASIKAADLRMILQEMQNKLYEKEFINAALYYKLERYPAAVAAMRNTLKSTPDTPYREEMLFLICQSWYNYAKNSIVQKKLDRYMQTVDAYYNFLSEYPESKTYLKDLEKMYAEAQGYIELNKETSLHIEKSRIDLQTRKDQAQQQKEKVKAATTKEERDTERQRLKEERTSIKQEKNSIRTETKRIQGTDSKQKASDRRAKTVDKGLKNKTNEQQ